MKLGGNLGWAVCRGVRDPARPQELSPATASPSAAASSDRCAVILSASFIHRAAVQ